MKILLIDNYDSFTYNLMQQLARVSGHRPQVVSNDQITWPEILALSPDLIVLSPGPGHPANPNDFGVCRLVLEQGTFPVIGVCLGFQGLACCYGGEVGYAPEIRHGRLSRISHQGGPLFAGIPQGFEVVRYHSLAVKEPVPECLEVLARAEDNVIMALRHRHLPQWGIQFHPESICTSHGDQLMTNLLKLCGAPPTPRTWLVQARSRIPTATQPKYRTVSFALDPERVYLQFFAHKSRHFWLDSSLHQSDHGRFSVMGSAAEPGSETLTYRIASQEVSRWNDEGHTTWTQPWFSFLAHQLQQRQIHDPELPFPFAGGYFGYLGYELKAETGASAAFDSEVPDALLFAPSRFLVFDHSLQLLYLVANNADDSAAQSWFDNIQHELTQLDQPSEPPAAPKLMPFSLRDSREQYLEKIDRCLDQIHEGNSYEVCLTTQICGHSDEDPVQIYRRLRRLNPAPYAACLRLDDLWVLSSSPEQFLAVSATGQVSTKPIKGTRPRISSDEPRDRQEALELAASVKERAENLMIVDLLRNDLGRVCQIDSVSVPKLMTVESYARVHQLVSQINGTLRPDIGLVGCIQAAFPGGSMTGAPKLRTLEILDRLESGPRGVYSGALGYLGFDGACQLSIVIRTAVLNKGQVKIGAGGAIVALSEPGQELDEVILKAAVLLEALGAELA